MSPEVSTLRNFCSWEVYNFKMLIFLPRKKIKKLKFEKAQFTNNGVIGTTLYTVAREGSGSGIRIRIRWESFGSGSGSCKKVRIRADLDPDPDPQQWCIVAL